MINFFLKTVAAPARCSWQGKVRSLVVPYILYGQHIYYTGNVLRVLTFQILFIVSKTSKFRTCLTVIRNCTVVKHKLTSVFLHTYAIKLILSHRSNEVE